MRPTGRSHTAFTRTSFRPPEYLPCAAGRHSGIAYPGGDGSSWCRLPHAVACPTHDAPPPPPEGLGTVEREVTVPVHRTRRRGRGTLPRRRPQPGARAAVDSTQASTGFRHHWAETSGLSRRTANVSRARACGKSSRTPEVASEQRHGRSPILHRQRATGV
ncbi:DUF6083 domain-containing protein [Streptomyces sp. NPDC058947]|uniref:DUF6083 domain-containing protein n=1 Tax=Streptomyces sp. NPDC058947 TaxID=3346675 RepID=UPI0036770192